MRDIRNTTRGVTVVEVMIGLTIFLLIFAFILQTLTIFFSAQRTVLNSTQALYLAEEGQEIVRYVRDVDWNEIEALSVDTPYYLFVATSTVGTTTVPETVGIFSRSFIVREAFRDADDDIVASTTAGATADDNSRFITVRVTWDDGDEEVRLSSLLTNLFNQ